ncbi:peptidoglycan-binding domain-containing protein [Devosia beringensis]|uniref:peptidoglycan-binding domain-containing protein n=1 Tax=Devosia beringensis TaxID=2657486 RepID=UPI00186B7951|nr:peptidoglycan-binding domain-containing protein [Devosia beringensis]
MTATTFTHLPLAAGSAVAASLGRAGLWLLARYMRAPLASTGLLVLVSLTALAASNALYFQTARHPAPFFAPARDVPVAVTAPADAPALPPLPTERSAVLAPLPASATTTETTGGIAAPAPVVPAAPVGNRDAFAVQKKLTELGLFNGTVDGFYGPMTANAIRAFEERNGLEPTGALNPAVVDAILKADAAGIMPAPQQAAAVATPPAPVTARPAPVQQAAVTPPEKVEVVARVASLTPVDTAVDTVGNAAAQTIDSILAAVTTTTPAAQGTTPRPAVALGSSAPVAPQPKPIQVASLEPMMAPAAAPVAAPVADVAPQQVATTTASTLAPANDVELVSKIQRGLASLGFYHGSIDGHPGDSTARAIREFENFHSYKLTGQVKPDLVVLLRDAGAAL